MSARKSNGTGRHFMVWTTLGTAAWWLARRAIRHARHFEFADRRVLVTGSSRGLGLVLARRLAEEGARVALCARDADELEVARAELDDLGADVLVLQVDVRVREDVERAVREVQEAWGSVDVLINNAGVIQVGPHETMTLADYEEAMRVHYWGPLYAMRAVIPGMRQRGEGRIVNIASIGGKISVPHLLPYSASKFALVGLSQGMRAVLLADGILVTTVCPGLMRTGSTVQARFKGQHRAEFAWFSAGASMPLLSMSAERAAHEILLACQQGRAHVVLSLPAQAASLLHGVAPGITADLLGLVDRVLPEPGGIGSRQELGNDSRPAWLPKWVTWLSDRAAARNNELTAS
ncbi:MAG: SDR family NAD(P)-dependent oxidoreductase [Pirellulaceae bacterium]